MINDLPDAVGDNNNDLRLCMAWTKAREMNALGRCGCCAPNKIVYTRNIVSKFYSLKLTVSLNGERRATATSRRLVRAASPPSITIGCSASYSVPSRFRRLCLGLWQSPRRILRLEGGRRRPPASRLFSQPSPPSRLPNTPLPSRALQ